MFTVEYYTKKRQDDANYLPTSEENKGLPKEEKMKKSPFYVEGDRKEGSLRFEIFTNAAEL